MLFPSLPARQKILLYRIVSVKVQFFCLLIGQNRITCRSTKHHVHCVLCRRDKSVQVKYLYCTSQKPDSFQWTLITLYARTSLVLDLAYIMKVITISS
jgi:hypothetical protein